MGLDDRNPKNTKVIPWRRYVSFWLGMAGLICLAYLFEWVTGLSSERIIKFAIALSFIAVLRLFVRVTLGHIRGASHRHNRDRESPQTK